MSPFLILLRVIHVVAGILWVGFAVFVHTFLDPVTRELGPDGGKVMGALQRRGLMTTLPILAILTLLSGLWLYNHDAAGDHAAYMATWTGRLLGLGGLSAIVAFLVGITIMRPAAMRGAAIMQSLATAAAAEREQLMAEVQRVRARGAVAGRVVTSLLILAALAMAVARYV
jgi:uncharacterized membrane protein